MREMPRVSVARLSSGTNSNQTLPGTVGPGQLQKIREILVRDIFTPTGTPNPLDKVKSRSVVWRSDQCIQQSFSLKPLFLPRFIICTRYLGTRQDDQRTENQEMKRVND